MGKEKKETMNKGTEKKILDCHQKPVKPRKAGVMIWT